LTYRSIRVISTAESQGEWTGSRLHQAFRHVEDVKALQNLRHARDAGIEVGVYFFAHPFESPRVAASRFCVLQADIFLKGDLPPALDLEEMQGHSWEFLNDWKTQWFAAVGRSPFKICPLCSTPGTYSQQPRTLKRMREKIDSYFDASILA